MWWCYQIANRYSICLSTVTLARPMAWILGGTTISPINERQGQCSGNLCLDILAIPFGFARSTETRHFLLSLLYLETFTFNKSPGLIHNCLLWYGSAHSSWTGQTPEHFQLIQKAAWQRRLTHCLPHFSAAAFWETLQSHQNQNDTTQKQFFLCAVLLINT